MDRDVQQVFEALDGLDKDGRQGTAAEAKVAMTRALTTTRAEGRREGFEKALEMAAGIVWDMLEWQGLTPVGGRIRAMHDERADVTQRKDPKPHVCECDDCVPR